MSPATLALAFESGRLNDGTETEYGFAWELGTTLGRRYTAHSGLWLAFESYYLRFPDERFSVLVWLNRTDGPVSAGDVAFLVANIYLK